MITAAVDRFPSVMPWVGGEYRRRQLRLDAGDMFNHSSNFTHVLGESHYATDDAWSADFTTRVICDWAFDRSRGSAFFTKILQATQGREAGEVDRVAGWSDLAFSNYVQDLLPANRMPPSEVQWTHAARCFVGQLAITRPRVLLVLGERLWNRLSADFGEAIPNVPAPNGAMLENAWLYPFWIGAELSITIAVKSYHPSSSRYNWGRANEQVVAASMLYDNLFAAAVERLKDTAPILREPDNPLAFFTR